MRLSPAARKWLAVLATILALALWWWAEQQGSPDPARDPGRDPGARQSQTTREDPDGLPTISVEALPPEARETITLIQQGGPFPYDRDGVVFENREGLLPDGHPRGYYREYTVRTPGEDDRGARRIVTGGEVMYYTADHYESFSRITGGRSMMEGP